MVKLPASSHVFSSTPDSMSYQVLARKWRPRRFADMAGQEHVVRALMNALDSGRLHHAYLFAGTRGVGKTTLARILAKALNCERGVSSEPCGACASCLEIDEGRFIDLLEVDAASRTKVEDTRELLENVQYAPARGRFKVYLIDEVHMLSGHSFNALLKTLEEPPPHVKFLFATTDPQKLPVTVLSRCLQFNLKRLPKALIQQRLADIAGAEKLEFETPALGLLASAADGSMRDALSLLDQLIAFGGGRIVEADAREMLGTVDRQHVLRLLETLARVDGSALMEEVARLDEQVPDYEALLDDLSTLIQRVALAQAVPEALPEDEADGSEIRELATAIPAEDLQLYYQIALIGRRDLDLAAEPRTGFEMILLRMLAFRPATAAPPPPRSAPAGGSRSRGPGTGLKPPTGRSDPDSAPPTPSDAWGELLPSLPVQGAARQLAVNCTGFEREGGSVRLQLDSQHDYLLTPNVKDKLGQALEQHFGQPVRLEIQLGEPLRETPARREQRAADERLHAARESLESDPNVRELQETFSATLELESVKPVD